MRKLKEIRTLNNLSLLDMAAKLNITKSFYWKIENEVCALKYDLAFKIAKIFGLRPDDIFYEDFNMKSKK